MLLTYESRWTRSSTSLVQGLCSTLIPPTRTWIGHRIWNRFLEPSVGFLRHPLGCLRWQDCWPFASFKVGSHTFRIVCFICKGHSGVPMSSDLYSGCIHVCGWHLFSIAGQLLHFKAGILFDGQGLIVSMPWIINVGTLSLIHYC